jgi:uncharacterized iron-regulated protein
MIKKYFLAVLLLFSSTVMFSQNGKAYQIFNKKGKKQSYKKMLKKLAKADVVFFGELHNNSIVHWLELQVTKDLFKKRNLVLGAEMIEADNQASLNKYLQNKIDKKALDTTARLWNNFKTDYKPLVDFAKDKKIKFVATNVPRRNAKIVFRKGFEGLNSLPESEKKWIAPLPVEYDKNLPGYVKMLEMMGGHGGENLPKAQAIKDATMAYFIAENLKKGKLFLHYNGSYHSDNFEGIVWYLKRKFPNLKIMTITTVEQNKVNKLKEENKNIANFIIAVPMDMAKSY